MEPVQPPCRSPTTDHRVRSGRRKPSEVEQKVPTSRRSITEKKMFDLYDQEERTESVNTDGAMHHIKK